jgi:hypothetical protein
LTVVTKEDNPLLKKMCDESGAHYRLFVPKNNIFTHNYLIFRTYILEDVKRNPSLWEKHQRRMLVPFFPNPWRWLQPRFFYALRLICSILPFLSKGFKSLERRLIRDQFAVDLVKEINPEIVISTRPVDMLEAVFLNAARYLNIKRIIATLSWDNITSKGFFPEDAEYFLSWGPIMTEEVKQYYHAPAKHIVDVGVPHFDVHFEVKQKPNVAPYLIDLGLDGTKPFMFFCMSAPYFCPDEIDIIEWLAKRTRENAFGPDMQFVARPHMQNVKGHIADPSWLDRLKAIQGDRVAVDFPSMEDSELTWSMRQDDMIKMSQLLANASICMNSCSTVAIESVLLDKPTVMPVFDVHPGYPDWKTVKRTANNIHMAKFLSYKGASIPGSLDELEKTILNYLQNPTYNSENRKKAALAEVIAFDGKATERFINGVHHFLKLMKTQG